MHEGEPIIEQKTQNKSVQADDPDLPVGVDQIRYYEALAMHAQLGDGRSVRELSHPQKKQRTMYDAS